MTEEKEGLKQLTRLSGFPRFCLISPESYLRAVGLFLAETGIRTHVVLLADNVNVFKTAKN